MIPSPDYVKRFESAKTRFLHGELSHFFEKQLPRFLGPILRDKLVDELIALLGKVLPLKDHLQPGQMVWNVVSVSTPIGAPNPRFVPVTLTMVHKDDVGRLSSGTSLFEVAGHAIARIAREAYEQGGLLSMRDIGLLTWHQSSSISARRKEWEHREKTVLPHTGSLHDMGTCVSHKFLIVRKIAMEKKDPYTVAKETNHSMRAVDRYMKDFHRVRTCYKDGKDVEFISLATGLATHVVNEYMSIIDCMEKSA